MAWVVALAVVVGIAAASAEVGKSPVAEHREEVLAEEGLVDLGMDHQGPDLEAAAGSSCLIGSSRRLAEHSSHRRRLEIDVKGMSCFRATLNCKALN